MTLSRREFHKSSIGLLALAAGGSLTLEGCSVLTDIQNGVNAAQSGWGLVLAELEKNEILTATNPLVGEVNAAFMSVQAALAIAESEPTQTTKQKIADALLALSAAIQAFLADAPIPPGALLTAIVGALSIVLSTIAGWLTELPAPAPPSTFKVKFGPSTFKVKFGGTVNITPKKRTARQVKKDWNSAVGGKANLKLHVSSF